MSEQVMILGGGPAGLGAAFRLSRESRAAVRLLERDDGFGGNAKTIAWRGHQLDLGDHRLSSSANGRILADVRELLDGDLLDRPRRARVRSLGTWLRHPVRIGLVTGRERKDRYLYPRGGIGQIPDALADSARRHGADLRLRHQVTEVHETDHGFLIHAVHRGESVEFAADHVWSTLPVSRLPGMLRPRPPAEVLRAADRIRFEGVVLVFLELAVGRFSDSDAYHLPRRRTRVSRVSEPKNFAARTEPAGRTVLTAEIPAREGGEVWTSSDVELAALVVEDLAAVGLRLPVLPTAAHVVRVPQAMPILGPESDVPLAIIHRHLSGRRNLLCFGNQGRFRRGDSFTALESAYDAVDAFIQTDPQARRR